jgi:acyl carrier protein
LSVSDFALRAAWFARTPDWPGRLVGPLEPEGRCLVADTNGRLAELRGIVAEVLEIEPEELTDKGDFVEKYEADSLRAIEILARIEKKYKVDIPQSELAEMRNLAAVYEVVSRYTAPSMA